MAHLLIVDDDEMNRDMLSRRLQRNGHTFELAEDGEEAWAALQARPFDLVLLDLMIPKIDGFEVLQNMKADADLQNTPVIMLSAKNDLESIYKALELGAEDYLIKPFNVALLRSRIDACLQRHQLLKHEDAWQTIQPGTPLADALAILTERLREPIDHSMRCVDQLLTRAAGPINDEQAELLGLVQSRLAEIVAYVMRNQAE